MNRGPVLILIAILLRPMLPAAEPGPAPAVADGTGTAADELPAYTLRDCYRHALVHNSEIRKARIDIDERHLSLLQSRAAFDPRLSAGYDYDIDDETGSTSISIKQELPGEWTLSAGATADNLVAAGEQGLSYNVSLSKALLGGNSVGFSLQGMFNARIDEAIARNSHAKLRRRLRRDVLKAYYTVVRELRTLSVQQRKVATAERNLQLAVERDRVIDVTNAEIQLSESQDQVVAALADIERSYDRLKRLIGMPVTDELSIVDDVTFTVSEIEPAADLLHAVAHHEDFLNLYLRIRKADNDIALGRERTRPDLSITATLSQGSDDDSLGLEGDVESSIGLDLGWTFGECSELAGHEKRLLARLRRDIELHDLHEDTRQEIRDLERRLEQSLARIDLAERRLAMRERLVTLYQDRYDNGEIDILELVRAQDQHQDAIVTLLSARLSYLEILADYRFAVGR